MKKKKGEGLSMIRNSNKFLLLSSKVMGDLVLKCCLLDKTFILVLPFFLDQLINKNYEAQKEKRWGKSFIDKKNKRQDLKEENSIRHFRGELH